MALGCERNEQLAILHTSSYAPAALHRERNLVQKSSGLLILTGLQKLAPTAACPDPVRLTAAAQLSDEPIKSDSDSPSHFGSRETLAQRRGGNATSKTLHLSFMSSPAAAAADKLRVLDIHDIRKPPAERRHSTSPRPAERIYRKTDIDRLLERAAFDCRLVQARDLLPERSDGDSTSEDEVEPVSDSEPREEGLGANAGSFPRPASRCLRKHSEPQCVEPRQKTFRGEEATLVWRRNDMDKHLGLRRSKRMSEESEDEIE